MVRAVDIEELLQKYVEENSLERADGAVPACDIQETGLNYSSLSVGAFVVSYLSITGTFVQL